MELSEIQVVAIGVGDTVLLVIITMRLPYHLGGTQRSHIMGKGMLTLYSKTHVGILVLRCIVSMILLTIWVRTWRIAEVFEVVLVARWYFEIWPRTMIYLSNKPPIVTVSIGAIKGRASLADLPASRPVLGHTKGARRLWIKMTAHVT
jgi:hypothetical protein